MMENNFDCSSLDTKQLVVMIEKEVGQDFEKAKKMLSFVDKNTNPIEYRYLYGMIREKEIYSEYDDSMRKKYDEYLSMGRTALKKKDYSQAYNLFAAGYYVTKNNIFNYYMGKVLFKYGNKRVAYPYFIKYASLGGFKLPKALLYIMSIYCEIGNSKKTRKYYTQLSYINKTFDHGFKIVSPFNKYGKLKDMKKRIVMTDEDFLDKGKILDLESYYDYDFDEKISIIESLFRDGKYNIALNLLNELNPSDKNQRRRVQELERNRVLYKNKMCN